MKSNQFLLKFNRKIPNRLLLALSITPTDSSEYLSKDFDTVLSNMLNDLDKEKKEIIILGDLNVDYLKQDNEQIKQSFQLNGFSQLIKSPTRITETTATLIDVLM